MDTLRKYDMPAQLKVFVEEGFLELLSEKDAEKTLEFHIPSKRLVHTRDHIQAYSVIWIHPKFNTKFCHYYIDHPGDLPNFYVVRSFSDDADERIPDLESVDDLIGWLNSLKNSEVA